VDLLCYVWAGGFEMGMLKYCALQIFVIFVVLENDGFDKRDMDCNKWRKDIQSDFGEFGT